MKPFVIPLLVVAAAGAMLSANHATPSPEGPLPWLHGFAPTALADTPSAQIVDRMAHWQQPDPDCPASAYGGLALAIGDRTILASYTQGVVVLDREHRLVARLAPLTCAGSADAIDVLAVGDVGIGQPGIVMVVTTGGHRTSTTWLALLRVHGDRLEPVFAEPVAQTTGPTTQFGDVTVMPGTLIYRAPDGMPAIWSYDRERGVFAPNRELGPNA